jgi:hypothetical protein
MNKMQFVEGDTDSMYWAISENKFTDLIVDHEFWNNNAKYFFPSDVIGCEADIKFDKKLLGLAIEKQSDNMIAQCSKCYTCFNNDDKAVSMKVKCINKKQNHLYVDDYKHVLIDQDVVVGTNKNLQLHNGTMSKIKLSKRGLTAIYTKMYVFDDFSTCAPLIQDVSYKEPA